MNNYLITRDQMTGLWLPHHKCIGNIFHLSNQNSNFSRKKFWFRDNLIDECWKTNNVALERFCKWMKFYGPFQTFAYTAVGTIFSQTYCFKLFIRFRCKSVAKKKSFQKYLIQSDFQKISILLELIDNNLSISMNC